MSHPAAGGHLGLVQVVREVLRFLSQSQQGLLFLLSHHQPTSLLLRVLSPLPALTHPLTHTLMETETEEAVHSSEACSLEDSFWAWLVQVLHALQGVAELIEAGMEGDGEGLGEGPVVLSTLNSLYLISFSPGGRDALTHTLCLDNNITCLTNILQHHAKEGQGSVVLMHSHPHLLEASLHHNIAFAVDYIQGPFHYVRLMCREIIG